MTVLSYLVPAAVVLVLSWAIVKLTRMPIGTPSIAAVTAVVAFGFIAITPLCGLMFDCGCDWPWFGLHHHCNIFEEQAKLKCLGATARSPVRSLCSACSAQAALWPTAPQR